MQVDSDLLIRYFLGRVSEEEKEQIHQWIESDEANRKRFMNERIRFDASVLMEQEMVSARPSVRWQPFVRRCVEIAAVIALLAGSYALYQMRHKLELTENAFQCIRVPAGNRTNVVLPDGTNVWLNAGSSLKYPLAFGKKQREVQLDGEGYFEVSKSEKPFVVKAGNYHIEVLGTIFDIEAYSTRQTFKTTLLEGKVRLTNDAGTSMAELAPGQTAEEADGKLRITATVDVNGYRWKDGLIYIDEDKSFAELMQLFEKFYDVRIVIRNPEVEKLGYRGKFRISDGLDHALHVLQRDFPFRYTREEESNTVYIH